MDFNARSTSQVIWNIDDLSFCLIFSMLVAWGYIHTLPAAVHFRWDCCWQVAASWNEDRRPLATWVGTDNFTTKQFNQTGRHEGRHAAAQCTTEQKINHSSHMNRLQNTGRCRNAKQQVWSTVRQKHLRRYGPLSVCLFLSRALSLSLSIPPPAFCCCCWGGVLR